ncbi:homeobox protein even skipped [Echinococcus multilocularis]|uniref:Segmentation protein even skipped n=1 Tax=Echinococcus multilocularis TaxID=6211 RepID=A0A068YAP9_ECHMU|nr:homeobox protein even skipped [Echinococcus multilocularis]
MYKPFSDTIASIPPLLTTFSHGELLSHLTSGLATLDTSATATAASTSSTSLCLCPYLTTAPPFPLPLPPLQLSFCCSPPSAPLLTSSPTPQSHHSDAIPAGTPASAIVAAEVKEQMPSASTSHLTEKRKIKETTMAGQMVVGRDIKRYRTTYSPYQSRVLEEVFQTERYISRPQRAQLATQLQLPENTIKVSEVIHTCVRLSSMWPSSTVTSIRKNSSTHSRQWRFLLRWPRQRSQEAAVSRPPQWGSRGQGNASPLTLPPAPRLLHPPPRRRRLAFPSIASVPRHQLNRQRNSISFVPSEQNFPFPLIISRTQLHPFCVISGLHDASIGHISSLK